MLGSKEALFFIIKKYREFKEQKYPYQDSIQLLFQKPNKIILKK